MFLEVHLLTIALTSQTTSIGDSVGWPFVYKTILRQISTTLFDRKCHRASGQCYSAAPSVHPMQGNVPSYMPHISPNTEQDLTDVRGLSLRSFLE